MVNGKSVMFCSSRRESFAARVRVPGESAVGGAYWFDYSGTYTDSFYLEEDGKYLFNLHYGVQLEGAPETYESPIVRTWEPATASGAGSTIPAPACSVARPGWSRDINRDANWRLPDVLDAASGGDSATSVA